MHNNLIAAIDVGSHAMRMKIGEIKPSGEFRELESFRKIVDLGHDTFTKGKVSFEAVDKVCSVLKIFKNTMIDYDIRIYKAMATSAVREASNKDYIVDQIKLKTGIDITVIGNAQEQFLTHKAIKNNVENYEAATKEGTVGVVIGAGSIQVTTFKDGKLTSSQNVKMGALRIKENLRSLENDTLKYYQVLDEYISSSLEGLDFFMDSQQYHHFIAVGGEMSVIQHLLPFEEGQEDKLTSYVAKDEFESLLKSLSIKSTEEIQEEYKIKKERAGIILPSMMLFSILLKHTQADRIIVPNISLTDGIIIDIYEELFHLKKSVKMTQDIITNAKVIASKFEKDHTHSEKVAKHALTIFDESMSIHGLKGERTMLHVAAILHDIGKFISLDRHYLHSYEIVKSLEIFGLSKEQMNIIANITKFHSVEIPNELDEGLLKLSEANRVIVGKLSAILRIADALDRSHKQKIKISSITIRNKELKITAKSNQNTKLEEWSFMKKAEFFQEVFGINTILKIKKEL
jgi:exopolyphosphatase/guanosine-5'-triphosphate,3'-diphosphate pyrophosphatase